jgi:Flp pilus assembly protein TadG
MNLVYRRENGTGNRGSQRGVIMMTFVLSLVFLTVTIGLAVDGGMLFLTRAKLQSAADAAALAATRSLNISTDNPTQLTDAQTAATNFFNANFPSGYLNSSSNTINTTLNYGATNRLDIKTVASVAAPTYFMRWFGYDTITITATATASRRDLNLVLVLDVSNSMNNGASPSACATMAADAALFIQQFSNNRDAIGVVTFNDGYYSYGTTTNFNPSMVNSVKAVTCTGDTNTSGGLYGGYQLLKGANAASTKLNALVLFTDGQAESIAADFPVTGVSNTAVSPALGPTGCVSSTVTGTFSENSNDSTGPDQFGITSGPWENVQSSTGMGWNMKATIPMGCIANPYAGQGFNSGSWNAAQQFKTDIAYIPSQDAYGNSTSGFRTDYNFNTTSFSTGQDEWPSGPYMGKLRTDKPITLYNAAANATDHQADTIRSNATYNPIVMTIGLGGNTGGASGYPVDAELLQRVANVTSGSTPPGFTNYPVRTITNSHYSSSQQTGLYIYSPTQADLAGAFEKIGSFLTELTK